MAKFVYLIASHNNPDQVIRLVKTLKAGSSDSLVVIHHDSSHCTLSPAAFESLNNVVVLEDPVSVGWGEFSMVQMELYCIDWILAHAGEFDWLIFLSGQDYPIKPITAIEQFLEAGQYDGYMDYTLADDPQEAWRAWRCWYHYTKISSTPRSPLFRFLGRWFNSRQPLIKFSTNIGGSYLGIRAFPSPFSPHFRCYTGSQWYTLSYACLEYVHNFVRDNPEFVKYFEKTLIPDEYFFQTILLNQPRFKIANDNKRYIAWKPPGRPTTLEMKDLEHLKVSEAHFARKFDARSAPQILDYLDRDLLDNKQLT